MHGSDLRARLLTPRTPGCAQELGVSILQDLHRQRQTITHARDTLHVADDNISKARRVLANMSRIITTNKLIMVGIILLLLVSIFLVVYYKFIKK
jgi:vesicle transport through interaction with t-SNAREs protein 1